MGLGTTNLTTLEFRGTPKDSATTGHFALRR